MTLHSTGDKPSVEAIMAMLTGAYVASSGKDDLKLVFVG